MSHVLPVFAEDKCSQCGRCVAASISTGDPRDFDLPSFQSECKESACPINQAYKPNSIQRVDISFIPCPKSTGAKA